MINDKWYAKNLTQDKNSTQHIILTITNNFIIKTVFFVIVSLDTVLLTKIHAYSYILCMCRYLQL